MFGSVVLDVAIGMAFVYLLLSLIASVMQEIIAAFLQLRPANLLRGVRSLFSGGSWNGKDLVESIYDHGLIRGLYLDPDHDLIPAAKRAVAATSKQAGADAVAKAQAGTDASEAAAQSDASPGNVDLQAQATTAQKVETDAGTKVEASAAARGTAVQALEEAETKVERDVREWLRARLGFPAGIPLAVVSNQAILPAYIPSRTFALALIDILNVGNASGKELMPAITKSLADHCKDEENKAAQALQALAIDARDAVAFQKNLENWYNDSMDRASGWYKRYVQQILLAIGLVLAVVLNVDTVRVARTLWFDRDSRQAMVNAADVYVKKHPDPAPDPATAVAGDGSTQPAQSSNDPGTVQATSSQNADASSTEALRRKLAESADAFNQATRASLLPVGWKHSPLDYLLRGGSYLVHFKPESGWWTTVLTNLWRCLVLALGWLITGMAVSLGAPFWFDTLNKFMVVRSTVKPQEKSQTEGSKD